MCLVLQFTCCGLSKDYEAKLLLWLCLLITSNTGFSDLKMVMVCGLNKVLLYCL